MDPSVNSGMAGNPHSVEDALRAVALDVSDPITHEQTQQIPTRCPEPAASGTDYSEQASPKRNHPIFITFFDLPTSGHVDVSLYPLGDAAWNIRDQEGGVVRMLLEAPKSTMLPLRNFVINRRRFRMRIADACAELRLSLHLESRENLLHGCVDLPIGSAVTFESEFDRTNVIGRGSFALILGRGCATYSC
jgi:hypothetical protein